MEKRKIKIESPMASHISINGKEFNVNSTKDVHFSSSVKKFYTIITDDGKTYEINEDFCIHI